MAKKFVVYGSMCEEDVQEIATYDLKSLANLKREALSNNPNNHPDLNFWVEEEDR
jgi:hypothetical protein